MLMKAIQQRMLTLLLIPILGSDAHNGAHHPFINKRGASAFLANDCSSNPLPSCCTEARYEGWCEQASSREYCGKVNEVGREEICVPDPCPAGQTCYLRIPCKIHYAYGCDASNPCLAYPCENDGTCINTGANAFTCNCTPGYDPTSNCAQEYNECDSNPCQHGATCNDHVNMYNCTCAPGYTGNHCETEINECESNPCQNGATCHDHLDMYNCTCVPGYKGGNCETDINECGSSPCQHGATCHDHVNMYKCSCLPGYTGVNCETDINECDSNPCKNVATCHDHVNMYSCKCAPGYTGVVCETDIYECDSNPCQNGATCHDNVNKYSCTCLPGYNGVNCETDINECNSNPCQNGATCHDHVNKYNCTCAPGYTGVDCETDINECDSNPCQNGATCHDHVNMYNCTCVPGYTGYHCETDINECISNPCQNGATCHDHVNMYTCACVPGYAGVHCQTDINECDSNPCQNSATCHDHLNKYTCTCAPGYIGINCDIDVNECASDPCLNHGNCNDLVNHFTCDCTDRYNGTLCEKDCRPGPVDLLFVIDTSTSSVRDCSKVKDFVASLVAQLPVGPNDFQIAAVTYSFSAELAWNFTSFVDNGTVIEAINDLKCSGGATYTAKAMQFAIEMFKDHAFGARVGSAFQQIILLTDGMSTDRNEAIQQSWNILANNIRFSVVGIGHFVDHYELHSFVHDSRYVFSPTNNDALYQIFMETAHKDCDDCKEKSTSDILLLLDSSSATSAKFSTKAALALVGILDIENSDVHVGVTSYADDANMDVDIGKYLENDLLSSLTKILVRNSGSTNVSNALRFGKEKLKTQGRGDSRRLLILFSDGKFKSTDDVKQTIKDVTDKNTSVMIVGTGSDVSHDVIRQVVVDSYHALLTADPEDFTHLQTVRSEAVYVDCKGDIFHLRQ